MQIKFFLAASVASLSLAAGLSTPVMAQETSAAVRGEVTATSGPVGGAVVTIVHVPSGTVTTATTGNDGVFTASGLRPGGPYTVKVAAPGYAETSVTDIYTVVGQTFSLPVDLSSDELASADAGAPIIVTASRIKGAGNLSAGPTTVLTAQDISKVASVNRDIRDLMRRDPFATLDTSQSTGRQVTFAGQNPRFNRFTIDGVPISDSFGLNPDALPSRRGPVPLDSIGQFETKVAPYDIREGFFQGGVINAILRSGTNSFQGTAFYSFSSDELTGKTTKKYISNPTGVIAQPNFTSKDFGAEISGPIIKDKLFFMIAGERVRASLPVQFGTAETNAGTPVIGATNAIVSQIQSISTSKYGFNPGGIVSTNGDKDDRLVGKLDANLSDTQRLSLTGLYTKDSIIATTTTGNTNLGLESNAYVKPNKLRAGILQLNSDWGGGFSTEVRGIYKAYDSGQFPLLGRTAQFSVCAAPTSDRSNNGTSTTTNASLSCPSGTPQIVIGAGGPSQSNILRVRSYGGSFVGKLAAGDHSFRLLAEAMHTKSFNIFVNPSAGSYYFDSIADFQAGTAQSFTYNNAGSLNPDDAAAKFEYTSYTFGLQDDWRVNSMLNVSLGVRYDLFGSSSRPALNPNWLRRYGYPNTSFLSGRDLIQPRFGFTFRPTERFSVRGGGGIFGGGSPDVYVGNAFSNTGVINTSITARQTDGGIFQLNGVANPVAGSILNNPSFNTIPGAADAALQTAAANLSTTPNATTTLNALDPNLKIPSQFRGTLSFEYTADLGPLGDGWVFGADGLYSKVRNQLIITDLRSVAIAGSLTPDGRQRYTSGIGNNNDTGQDLLLTNTKYGRSLIGVLRLRKDWDNGLSLAASYTRQDVRDAGALTSSIASSIYNNGAYLDPNFGAPGHSNDEVKWSFHYNVSFEHEFIKDAKTRIDLFGETRAGSPFSYTFQDTSGGRSSTFGTAGSSSRYLFYVPTGINDPLVSYDSAATAQRIDDIISSSGLAGYRGKIAPRNAFRSKAFTRIDLHVEQEVPLPFGTKLSLFGDIENFTNLINHNWGQQLRSNFPFSKVVSRVTCVASGTNACAQYKYSQPSTDTQLADQLITTNGSSLYAIRVGVRLSF